MGPKIHNVCKKNWSYSKNRWIKRMQNWKKAPNTKCRNRTKTALNSNPIIICPDLRFPMTTYWTHLQVTFWLTTLFKMIRRFEMRHRSLFSFISFLFFSLVSRSFLFFFCWMWKSDSQATPFSMYVLLERALQFVVGKSLFRIYLINGLKGVKEIVWFREINF